MDSAKSNGGKKPVLRNLTARIDRYDYKLDLDNMILTLKIHSSHEVKLKLLASKERVEKFRGWGNYELVVKYENGELWVSIYFKKAVEPVKQRTIMAIDLNFDNLTLAVFTLNGRVARLKRFETPLRKILTHAVVLQEDTVLHKV